jgi:hypothetical protein
MNILTDSLRQADVDNPKGYYEYERVKDIETNKSWLSLAQGKVVKIISALLFYLPEDYVYKVIFMRRKMEEILASQRKMLIHRGEASNDTSDEKIAQVLYKHLKEVESWIFKQPNIDVLFVDYGQTINNPHKQAKIICDFLDGRVDPQMMAAAVDNKLYRERK